ncbi:MAG TPA: sodium:solute symporter family protein [Kofleriaceae bacterium]|nr:sodium:solute symporter family protein [Kofleriaceae bacterium]
MSEINWTELVIFAVLFAIVAAMGFVASRWRRPATMAHLDEWGLGGRSFGGWVTWFLIGGDLYTAYTFVAVPALLYGAGGNGFFAMPYTVITYPLAFLALIRLWSVSHRHGFVTPADFVRARFGSPALALLVAITGIVATMPYIALQLIGIEAVLKAIGLTGDSFVARHLPLIIAFGILAAYTYQSGLRAPALIAFVKDTLIYIVIIVAVIYIPHELGGWGAVFDAADQKFTATKKVSFLLADGSQLQYITLAFGSALALFLYPHSVTGVLASKNRDIIKRNMAALPAYSLLLGLIALLGFMAIAAKSHGVGPISINGKPDGNTIVPVLFDRMFPSWFAGIAYAAIGIGALVPAAIMSIAAANLFTRNIYVEYLAKDASHADQARVSKIVSLVVKLGALLVIVLIDPQFSIDLQLIGGVIILQTLPAVALGLFTRWFHRTGLIAGWIAGMTSGLWMLYNVSNPATGRQHFASSAFLLSKLGLPWNVPVYAGFLAVAVNLIVVVVVTLIARGAKLPDGGDATVSSDYFADEGDPKLVR